MHNLKGLIVLQKKMFKHVLQRFSAELDLKRVDGNIREYFR